MDYEHWIEKEIQRVYALLKEERPGTTRARQLREEMDNLNQSYHDYVQNADAPVFRSRVNESMRKRHIEQLLALMAGTLFCIWLLVAFGLDAGAAMESFMHMFEAATPMASIATAVLSLGGCVLLVVLALYFIRGTSDG